MAKSQKQQNQQQLQDVNTRMFHYESQRRGWILTIQQQHSEGVDLLTIEELEQVWESDRDNKPFYLSIDNGGEEDAIDNFDAAAYDPIFDRLSQLLRDRTNNQEVFFCGHHLSHRLVSLVTMFPNCRHLFLPKITNFQPLVTAIQNNGELTELESLWIGGYGTSSHVQEKQPSQDLVELADAISHGGLPNLKHFQLQNRILLSNDGGDDPWECVEALVCALTTTTTTSSSSTSPPRARRGGVSRRTIKVEISRIFVVRMEGGSRRPRVQPYALAPEHETVLAGVTPPSYYRLLNQRLRQHNLSLYPILNRLVRSNPNLSFQDIQEQVDFNSSPTALRPWVEALQAFQGNDRQAHQALAFKPVLAAAAASPRSGRDSYGDDDERNQTKRTVERTLAEAVSLLDSPTCSFSNSTGDFNNNNHKGVLTRESLLGRSSVTNSDLVSISKTLMITPTTATKTGPRVNSSRRSSSSSLSKSSTAMEDYSSSMGMSSSGGEHERVMRQALEASQQQLDAARENLEQAKEDVRFDQALLQKQESRMFSDISTPGPKAKTRRPDRDAAWHALKNQLRASQLEEQKALQEFEMSKAGHLKVLQMLSRKTRMSGVGIGGSGHGLLQEMNYGTPMTTKISTMKTPQKHSQSQQRQQQSRLIHSA